MMMHSSRQLLSSILAAIQMGQINLRSMLRSVMQPGLRNSILLQLAEYDAIERQAHSIACARGWELYQPGPAVRFITILHTRLKLGWNQTDSKLAAYLIVCNTKFIISGLKNIHQFTHCDSQVEALSQKHLDCQRAGIYRLQRYL